MEAAIIGENGRPRRFPRSGWRHSCRRVERAAETLDEEIACRYTYSMSDKRDFLECQACQCLEARRRAQALTRAYDETLRPFGLTINQFSLLTTLILAGPQPVASLAARLGIDRTTLTRNLALGEREGLVALAPDEEDRRVRLVTLTPAGLSRAREALPAWRAVQARFA